MISKDLIKNYLSPSLGNIIDTYQGVKVNCPKCDEGDKYNLEINLNKNIFNCWSCHYSGYIKQILEDYATHSAWRDLPQFKNDSSIVISEEKLVEFPTETIPYYLNDEVNKYLRIQRGIPKQELVKRKVQYVYSKFEKYYNHIYFPFYKNGVLVGAALQNMETKRYVNLGKQNFVPWVEFINPYYPITITEGIYDALSGINAIPQLGTNINDAICEFFYDKDIIYAVDKSVNVRNHIYQIGKIEKSKPRSFTIFDMGKHEDMNDLYRYDREHYIKEYKDCFEQILKLRHE